MNKLFLTNGAARRQQEYETAGRRAVAILVQQGERDDFRRAPATIDELWNKMSKQAQPSFGFLTPFRSLSGTELAEVTGDFTVIKWWARSMHEMSERLAEVRKFIDSNPGIDSGNKKFTALRRNLASKLKDVASKTKGQFGDPWGLVAMDQASGGRASAKAFIMGPTVAVFRERQQ